MGRGGAEHIYAALRTEINLDGDTADGVLRAWYALMERADVPVAWRRHPHLLAVMLRRAGVTADAAAVRRAHRWRLTRLPAAVRRARGVGPVEAALAQMTPPPSTAWLATCDGPTLADTLRQHARRYGWSAGLHDAVRAHLRRACVALDDAAGRFQTHRRLLPARLLDRHPTLYEFPVEVGRFMARCVPDPADVDHVLGFVRDVVRRRLLRLPPHRDTGRAVCSVGRRVAWVLSLVWAGAPEPETAREWRTRLWPASMTANDLLDRVARGLGALHRRGRPRWRWRSTPTVTDARRVVCGFLRCCVACGVFEPRICATAAVLGDLALERRLLELETADAERYRARPMEAVRLLDRPELTTSDVDALRRACRTARERAFLALVSTTGVRSCAVALARVEDVWDDAKGEVRQRVFLREKNSDTRSLVPCPALREALRTYVLECLASSSAGDAPRLLFPGQRRPGLPSTSAARSMLRTLCRRAGLGRTFSPHQFRQSAAGAYQQQPPLCALRRQRADETGQPTGVCERADHGRRCTTDRGPATKWLGHRSTAVTYRHYWTDETLALRVDGGGNDARVETASSLGGGTTNADMDQLYEALRAKVAEVEMLRALVVAQPPPLMSDG